MSGDTAELRERDAKRVDALKAAKMAGLAGDNGPALELAGIEDGERIAAEAEANAAAMIDAAKTGRELADVLAALAPLPFGAALPLPVLWRDVEGDPAHVGTVLCRGEVAMLSGPGEAGKSTVVAALADAARDGGTACTLRGGKWPSCRMKIPAPGWRIGSDGMHPPNVGRTSGTVEARPLCGKWTRSAGSPADPVTGALGGMRQPASAPGSL